MILLIVADAQVDVCIFEGGSDFVHRGLAIVIGVKDFGLDALCGAGELCRGHRVGLVAREECDIDVADAVHLGYIFGVASNINAEVVER